MIRGRGGGARKLSPQVEHVISTEARRAPRGGRNGEISRAMFQIHYYLTMPPRRMGRCPRGERAGGEGDILIFIPHSLAQNRGFCAKEEPQALKADKADLYALLRKAPCGDDSALGRINDYHDRIFKRQTLILYGRNGRH